MAVSGHFWTREADLPVAKTLHAPELQCRLPFAYEDWFDQEP